MWIGRPAAVCIGRMVGALNGRRVLVQGIHPALVYTRPTDGVWTRKNVVAWKGMREVVSIGRHVHVSMRRPVKPRARIGWPRTGASGCPRAGL